MDGHDAPQLRGSRHALVQRQVIDRLEIIDAAVAHEGFEADHAALREFFEPVDIVRHQPAPQREIDQS